MIALLKVPNTGAFTVHYARSPSPPPPPSRENPLLSRVLVTIGNYKRHPFSGLSREIFPKLLPPPQKKKSTFPSCIRVGLGGGGGGGGVEVAQVGVLEERMSP